MPERYKRSRFSATCSRVPKIGNAPPPSANISSVKLSNEPLCGSRPRAQFSDRSELTQQRHYLALEAQRIFVIREKDHQHTVHARTVQAVEVFGDLLASAEDRQCAAAKREHLEREVVERAALRK